MSKEYKILTSETAEALERLVAGLLAQGWQLQGGVSVAAVFSGMSVFGSVFAQALVRGKQESLLPLAGTWPKEP